MLLRVGRLTLLLVTVSVVLIDGFLCQLAGLLTHSGRASWLQRNARRLAWALGLESQVLGQLPTKGLIVANHLGYLDIVMIGAAMPCRFVAKQEVKSWPVFGWFSSLGGTIFVNRESKLGVAESTRQIHEALSLGELLVLFAEGTSSGGTDVLPFKSSLLLPCVTMDIPTTAAAVFYQLKAGEVSEEVCYWKEMTLLPHLFHLAGHQGLSGQVAFGEGRIFRGQDRKTVAKDLREEVLRLKTTLF